MNCFNHPTEPAVIQCRRCGRGFCKDCASTIVDGLCADCRQREATANAQYWQESQKQLIMDERKWHISGLIYALVGLVIGFIYAYYSTKGTQDVDKSTMYYFAIFSGLLVFVFRYARRLVRAFVARLAGRDGCLVNIFILLIMEVATTMFLSPISLLLLIYSIARVFFLKKGVSDYFKWLKYTP